MTAATMRSAAKGVSSLLPIAPAANSLSPSQLQLQQWRGIRVKVVDNNLERALALLERKMRSCGMEAQLKREQTHHIKNSEKRVIARKALEYRLRSEDFARKLKTILVKKVRGL